MSSGSRALPDFRSFAGALLSNQTGLSTFGALLGVLAGAYYGCRSLKLNFLQVLDHVCLVIPVGHAIARVGCFLTGCCYGHPTDGSHAWSVVFTDPAAAVPPALLGVPLHATQLYEAAGDLLLGALLYFLIRPGVGRGRFGSGLRGDPEMVRGTALPLAQFCSLLLISVAVVFLLLAAKVRPAAGQKATVH
jgi:phosphatidylglycerol---prolipoprotein diacylglyceryl transferase